MGQMRVRDTRSFGHAMEEHAMAWFKFDSDAGGFGLVEAGHNPVHPYSIVLQGTEGTIRIAGNNLLIDTPAGRREEQPADPDTGGGYVGLFHGFANWLDGGEVPLNGLPRAYGSAELNLATYLSAVRGDRVDLPLSEQDLQLDEWPVEIAQRRHAAGDDAVKA